MVNSEQPLSSNAIETNDIRSARKGSIHSQTSYVHVQTRKKSCVIISVIATILVITVIVTISKIALTKTRTTSRTTQAGISDTTTPKPIVTTRTATTSTVSWKIVQVTTNTTWNKTGMTIAGGNSHGSWLDQLAFPAGFDIDDDLSIYVADRENNRIVGWRLNAKFGEVLAGGNGSGNRTDQLSGPSDVVVDRKSLSLIICDRGNSRLIRLLHNSPYKQATVILKIDCNRLTMDRNGDLYISSFRTNTVKRWRESEADATIVAGENEHGDSLDRLNAPEHIFVDEDHSIYISDSSNHRVVKWTKGAKEGVLLAGGEGAGNSLSQLNYPAGLVVDHSRNIYVVDKQNHRVMRFSNESRNGVLILGGYGHFAHQLTRSQDISFDRQGNLYVVDTSNHRVQKFFIHL